MQYPDDFVNKVICGECLGIMKDIPDKSIDVIITDPPYFKVKSENWDRQWDDKEKFIEWIDKLAKEWSRILKISGSIYVFASSKLAAHIEITIAKYLNVLNHIVWERQNEAGYDGWKQKCSKESLRAWYPNSERIIFAENNYIGTILKTAREKICLSTIEVAEKLGAYGSVNHGGSVSNWEKMNIFPPDHYYLELQKLYGKNSLPDILEAKRPFQLNKNINYTDIWHFQTVKHPERKHCCEKPQDLLCHIINASSDENNLILDCFAGSGSTLIACKKLKRRFVGIELNVDYCEISKERLNAIS